MKLEHARKLAMEVLAALSPACDHIVVAGSIRRDKPSPTDIEIVYTPSITTSRIDLFTHAPVPATDPLISNLAAAHFWVLDPDVKRNGPKHKCLILPGRDDDGRDAIVKLFRADVDNWGYILALHTGPSEFNSLWSARDHQGGALTSRFLLRDDYLWHNGIRCYTPDEPVFFATIGIPCWPPEERSAARLGKYLVDHRRIRQET